MLRIHSPLHDDLESLITKIIGLCINVHRELGPGLSERYKGKLLCHQRIDLLIDRCLVLELKSVEAIHRVHISQTATYLRLTGAKAGLVVNFNVELLRYGIKRVVS